MDDLEVNMNWKPTIISGRVFSNLKRMASKLTAGQMAVALGLEVFEVHDVLDLESVAPDVALPEYIIIIDIRFIATGKNVYLGSIMYYSNSNLRLVGKSLKAYIKDLLGMKFDVLSTISSGELEIMKVLKQGLKVNLSDQDLLQYYIQDYGYMRHTINPVWMLELRGEKLVTDYMLFGTYDEIHDIPIHIIDYDVTQPVRNIFFRLLAQKQEHKDYESISTAYFCFCIYKLCSTVVIAGEGFTPSDRLFWEHLLKVVEKMHLGSLDLRLEEDDEPYDDEDAGNEKKKRNFIYTATFWLKVDIQSRLLEALVSLFMMEEFA